MGLSDAQGLPLAMDIASAQCAEVHLVEPLIDSAPLQEVSPQLIYDRVADSDPFC